MTIAKAAFLSAALLGALLPGLAHAQDNGEEIVITGSYMRAAPEKAAMPIDVMSADLVIDQSAPPFVTIPKRADFAIVALTVSSDTRDLSTRRNELRGALRSLMDRTKGSSITLRLLDQKEGIVRDFSLAAALESLAGYDPAVHVFLRTPISADDTLQSLHERITAFVAATPKPGRVELEEGALDLTLLDPEQHRSALLAAIAVDGKQASGAFGENYGIVLAGADNRVAWERTGDLDLNLYISYAMEVTPNPAR